MNKKIFLFALMIFTLSLNDVNAQSVCDSKYTPEIIASLQQNMDPADLDLSALMVHHILTNI